MTAHVENIAQGVLRSYWGGSLPISPDGIANAMGLQVIQESPFAHPSVLNGASGFYTKGIGPFGRPQIYVSSGEPSVRQRFTIAHELGHHVLNHGDAFRDDKQTFNLYNRDPREIEANAFAAALLMPRSQVMSAVDTGRGADIQALANDFGVSEVAMLYRLKNLGWVRA